LLQDAFAFGDVGREADAYSERHDTKFDMDFHSPSTLADFVGGAGSERYVSLLHLNGADEGQVAQTLGPIEPVADYEVVTHFKTYVIRLQRRESGLFFEQRAHAERGGSAGRKNTRQVLKSETAVDDVLHNDDILSNDGLRQVMGNANGTARFCVVAVTGDSEELNVDGAVNRAREIGSKNKTALKNTQEGEFSWSDVCSNLSAQLGDTRADLFRRDHGSDGRVVTRVGPGGGRVGVRHALTMAESLAEIHCFCPSVRQVSEPS
jgi:hypothetical protein